MVGIILILAVSLLGFTCPAGNRPIIAHYSPDRINVDGRLNESAWTSAQWTLLDGSVTVSAESGLPPELLKGIQIQEKNRVEAAIVVNDEGICFAMRAEDRDVQSSKHIPNDWIWLEDVFEIFISPPMGTDGNAGHPHYEFQVNALGNMFIHAQASSGVIPGKDVMPELGKPEIAVYVNGTLNKSQDNDQGWQMECLFTWEYLKKIGIARPRKKDPEKQALFHVRFAAWDLTIHSILRMNKFTLPGSYNPHETQFYRPVFIKH